MTTTTGLSDFPTGQRQQRCSTRNASDALPATDRDLPRSVCNLVCVPFPLPRRIASNTSVWIDAQRPSPVRWWIGIRDFTFEACSGFTCKGNSFTALRPARSLPRQPGASIWKLRHRQLLASTVPNATGAYRKLPGRVSHPLATHDFVAHNEPTCQNGSPTHPPTLPLEEEIRPPG